MNSYFSHWRTNYLPLLLFATSCYDFDFSLFLDMIYAFTLCLNELTVAFLDTKTNTHTHTHTHTGFDAFVLRTPFSADARTHTHTYKRRGHVISTRTLTKFITYVPD